MALRCERPQLSEVGTLTGLEPGKEYDFRMLRDQTASLRTGEAEERRFTAGRNLVRWRILGRTHVRSRTRVPCRAGSLSWCRGGQATRSSICASPSVGSGTSAKASTPTRARLRATAYGYCWTTAGSRGPLTRRTTRSTTTSCFTRKSAAWRRSCTSPWTTGPGTTGVYFPVRTDRGLIGLTLIGDGLTREQQHTAVSVFRGMRFLPTSSEPSSTGPGASPAPELSGLLGLAPAEFSEQAVVFSFNNRQSPGGGGPYPEGRIMHPEVAANLVNLDELAGLGLQERYERGIWSWESGNGSRTFMAFQGTIAKPEAGDRLRELGFGQASHLDTPYFELGPDFGFDIRHELRRTGLTFNRVAISEDGVLAAPATGIIEALIDAGQGASETLADSPPPLGPDERGGRGTGERRLLHAAVGGGDLVQGQPEVAGAAGPLLGDMDNSAGIYPGTVGEQRGQHRGGPVHPGGR